MYLLLFGIFAWAIRHPALPILQRLKSSKAIPIKGSAKNMVFCESCQMGKTKRLPFVLSTFVSTFPQQIIHSDEWMSPIPSISGC